jgi:hypothetical protein
LNPAILDSLHRNLRYRRVGDPQASLWTGATQFASADMAEGYLGGLEGQYADYDGLIHDILPYLPLAGATELEAEAEFELPYPLHSQPVQLGDGTVLRALTVTVRNGARRVDFAIALLAVRFDAIVLEYVARSLVEPVADPEAMAPPVKLLRELETMARYFGNRTPGGAVMLAPELTHCTGGLWDLLPAGTDLPDGRVVREGRITAATQE